MSKNLLEQTSEIVAAGRQDADRFLEAGRLIALETREWVLPAKDSAILNWIKADKRRRRRNASADIQPNRLIYGDDLLVMSALLAGDSAASPLQEKIDLICMDQPFCIEDGFEAGIACYLASLVPRLVLARELLTEHGSIFLRVEGRAKYSIKRMINELFGCAHPAGLKIAEAAFVDPASGNGSAAPCRDHFIMIRKCEANRLRCNDGAKLSCALELDEAFPIRGKVRIPAQEFPTAARRSLAHKPCGLETERTCGSSSAARIGTRVSNERVRASQEPAPLLEAIILAATGPDSIVADFSGRSGRTACIAERLGRRWITSDSDQSACAEMRRRLIEQNAEPFLYQAIDPGSKKTATVLHGDACRAGDLVQIVLLLFGAQPLPLEQDPDRRLGQFFDAGSKTLVRVESPYVSTGMASLREAITQRGCVAGNWDRIVVLAWKLEPSIDAIIEELGDSRLEVLSISADLIEMLSKSGETDGLRKTACFAETQT